MRSDEARALGAAVGEAIAEGATRIEELHRAIAGRAFSATSPASAPVAGTHDAISAGVYASVRTASAALGRAAGLAYGLTRTADAPSLGASARGAALLGALNGAFGDTIAERHAALGFTMAVRKSGEDVPLEPAALRLAFPGAGPRVAVYLHGLCESERSWHRRADAHGRGLQASYATLLEEDLGLCGVVLRYNTGLHISENAEELDRLLVRLCAAWPVPITEIAFVGHSMGGLVARAACHHGRVNGHDWVALVRHLVCLGTPHLGAPLERVTNRATHLLMRLPETRPIARLVNHRAVGVKDLRFGATLQEHWAGKDLDAITPDDVDHVEELPHATHFCVSSTLGATEDHLLGRLLGDVLVPKTSAAGTGHKRRRPLRFDASRHFPGLSHFDLLNHPEVYAQLRGWLAPRPQRQLLPGPAPALLTR